MQREIAENIAKLVQASKLIQDSKNELLSVSDVDGNTLDRAKNISRRLQNTFDLVIELVKDLREDYRTDFKIMKGDWLD